MKILIVIGTRPEAIKMAALVSLMKSDKFFKIKVCITGQHKEMLDQVLRNFDIKPDFDFKIMKNNQTLTSVTNKTLMGLENIFKKFVPDFVFVHGDTISSFSAALASYYCRLPIAHVEAGLRTNNIYSPWPEEGSRKLIDVLSSIHFAPTLHSHNNLIAEGVKKKSIYVTGNTVIDSLFFALSIIKNKKSLLKKLEKEFSFLKNDRKLILITAHRRENFGKPFTNICKAMIKIANENEDVDIVYPIHPNPNINEPGKKYLSNIKNIYLVSPLDYFSFVHLMNKSYLILTDSGGIQEEAPSLKKPVLVLRDETERTEALEAGTIKLVGTNTEKIFKTVNSLLHNKKIYKSFIVNNNPYGDGNASKKIIKVLKLTNKLLIK